MGESAELVRVAQPIVRCVEIGRVSDRSEIAERGVGALVIVACNPTRA